MDWRPDQARREIGASGIFSGSEWARLAGFAGAIGLLHVVGWAVT
jgi:hypothetical protein